MGFIGGLFGGNSGASMPNIRNEVSRDEIQGVQRHGRQGLEYQDQFVQALMGLSGAQNPELARQAQIMDQQQALAGQLQGMSQGQGPNPALAQLAQSTGQNVANQAALMAGQRGTSANAGLLARQIAQQGANTQQQAAGQGATLQAQQQLAATEALQRQQQLLGNMAAQRVGQQQAGLGQYSSSQAQRESNLLNAVAQQNNATVSAQGSVNQAESAAKGRGQQFGQQLFGGLLGAFAHGGEVPHYAMGGLTDENSNGALSFIGKALQGAGKAGAYDEDASNYNPIEAGGRAVGNILGDGVKGITSGIGQIFSSQKNMAAGAAAPMSSKAQMFAHGGKPVTATMLAAQGSVVPGKALVRGDSLKNDKINAKLSPGEIVIPRSIAQGDNAPEKAKEFVAAILAKNKTRKKL